MILPGTRFVQPWRPRTYAVAALGCLVCVAVGVLVVPLLQPALTHTAAALVLGQVAAMLAVGVLGFRLLLRRVWTARDGMPAREREDADRPLTRAGTDRG